MRLPSRPPAAALALLLALLAPFAAAAADLQALLREAVAEGRTQLRIPGGDLGAQRIEDLRPPAPILLIAADPQNPPVLRGLQILSSGNLILDGFVFAPLSDPDAPDDATPNLMKSVAGVTIRNALFDGPLRDPDGEGPAAGFAYAKGLHVRYASDVTVETSRFQGWKRGAVFDHVDGLTVRGNEITAIRSDGLDFAAVRDAAIIANHLHDFDGAPDTGDHRDMIQFWTAGTDRPSERVRIEANLLDSGEGSGTQSIFIRNEMAERDPSLVPGILYRDFVIADNVIRNAHVHGITISGMTRFEVRDNTVLQDADTGLEGRISVPQINLRGMLSDGRATGNVAPAVNDARPEEARGLSVRDNVEIQRTAASQPDHYARAFADGMSDGRDAGQVPPPALRADPPFGLPASALKPLMSLQALPEGAAAQAGSALTRIPGLLPGWISARPAGGTRAHEAVFALQGEAAGARAAWRIDGAGGILAEGPEFAHDWGAPGRHTISAALPAPGGGEMRLARTLRSRALAALKADFTAAARAEEAGRFAPERVPESRGAVLEPGSGLRLRDPRAPGPGAYDFGLAGPLRNLDRLTIAATVRMDGLGQGGGALYHLGGLILQVGDRGSTAQLSLSERRQVTLQVEGGMRDGRAHEIAVIFDGAAGEAWMEFDGRAGPKVGGLEGLRYVGSTRHGFQIGSPRKTAFGGLVLRIDAWRAALSGAERDRLRAGDGG